MTHKQVIVIRKDLKCRRGKEISQGCHASLGVILNAIKNLDKGLDDNRIAPWINGSFTKVCVYVNSEEEIHALKEKADKNQVLNCLITDNGQTEFGGVKTVTCIAIGPDTNERVNEITGHLPLL